MKLKYITILSLSLIYSANVFSTTPEDNSLHAINNDLFTSPILNELITDNYIIIEKNINSKNDSIRGYSIKMTDEILSKLSDELNKKGVFNKQTDIGNEIRINNSFPIDTKNHDIRDKMVLFFQELSKNAIGSESDIIKIDTTQLVNILQGNKDIALTMSNDIEHKKRKLSELKDNPNRVLDNINGRQASNERVLSLEKKTNEKLFNFQDENRKSLIGLSNTLREEKDDNKNNIKKTMNNTTKINEHSQKIDNNATNIDSNNKQIKENKDYIDTNTSNIEINKEKIETNSTNIKTNKDKIKTNTTNIETNKSNIETNTTNIETNKDQIETNSTKIETNRDKIVGIKEKYIENFDVLHGGKNSLHDHLSSLYMLDKLQDNKINTLENNFEQFKSETQNRFYKVEKRANQGIASVAAMSNLPFSDSVAFSTAIGIGHYRNATALAWGMQYRINETIKVKASTSWSGSDNWVSAGGVGISW